MANNMRLQFNAVPTPSLMRPIRFARASLLAPAPLPQTGSADPSCTLTTKLMEWQSLAMSWLPVRVTMARATPSGGKGMGMPHMLHTCRRRRRHHRARRRAWHHRCRRKALPLSPARTAPPRTPTSK